MVQTTQTPPTPAAPATKELSNGKIVVLTEYGWHQPQEQLDECGDLNATEAAEAWKLWDAAQKTTPPGAQPNNPVGERPIQQWGAALRRGTAPALVPPTARSPRTTPTSTRRKRNASVAKKGGLR